MSGNFTQTQFSISINATTFDLLINKLYKDKPQSIIRELVSNAWDAHIDAKTTHIPVQVTLPTYEESTLVIKDFGTGLSPERMVGLYCTICMSDRDKTNDFLGGYGLGSKSPHSYTSQYTVQSRWNGICYTYSIFRGPDGTPTIALVDETSTDEHNGLTIFVPVKKEDRFNFIAAAEKVLPWFPNIDCSNTMHKHVPLWEKEGVSLYNKNDVPTGVYAKVGCVLYPLDLNVMKSDICNTTSYCWKAALVLDVPIGKIGITPAREDLSYDPETIRYLNERLENAKWLLQEDAKQIVHNAATYKQALIDCRFLRVVLNNFKWWDNTLRHPSTPNKPLDNRITTVLTNVDKIGIINQSGRTHKFDSWADDTSLTVHIEQELNIFFADPSLKYLKERIRQIPRWSLSGPAFLVVTTDREKKQFEECTAGKINFGELADYYVEPRSSKNYAKRATLKVNTIRNDVTTINTDKAFYYLEGKHGQAILKGKSVQTLDMYYALKVEFDEPIVLVPPSKMPYIKKLKNSVDFNIKFDELCAEWLADKSLWEAIAASESLVSPLCHRYNTLKSEFAKNNPTHPVIKLQTAIERGNTHIQFTAFLRYMEIVLPTVELTEEFDAIYKKYEPFLKYVEVDSALLTAYDFYLEHKNA